MLRVLLFFSLILLSMNSFAQEERQSTLITTLAEQLAEEGNDPGSVENYADLLRGLAEDPVDINSGDENEISRLFFLTGFQVKVLCDYVKRNGRILTVYEIANIPGFDSENTKMLIPFITLTGNYTYTGDSIRLRNSFQSNMTVRPGPADSSFNGSALKLLARYRFAAGRFSGGLTIEKDQGEKLFTGKPPLPDFVSGNISYSGHAFIRRVIAGDFSARFGQGLALNTPASFGYSLSSPVNLSGRDEIKPYTSADENNFFRGIALTAQAKRTSFSLFVSSNRIDATLAENDSSGSGEVANLYSTGIHNTSSTLEKKDILCETAAGLDVSHSSGNMSFGFLIFLDIFSLPFTGSSNPTNLYGFKGRTNRLYSGYYSLLAGKFIFSGEACYGGDRKAALIQNVAFRPAERLTINLGFRDYLPGFISFHGKSPFSATSPVNEIGITGSFLLEVAKYLFINAGTDLRLYPWPRYRNSGPSSATRHEVRIRYLPAEKANFEILFSRRSGSADSRRETGIPFISENITTAARFQARYQVSEKITLTSRIDYKTYEPAGNRGVSFLQDMSFKPGRFTLWFRYCVFSTDSYYTSIYAWENDLLYGFSIPALYGKGNRMYLVAAWNPVKDIELRFKYGITSAKTSGMNCSNDDELKFQILAKF